MKRYLDLDFLRKVDLPPGKEVVLTSKEYLTEEASYVPLGGELTEKGT